MQHLTYGIFFNGNSGKGEAKKIATNLAKLLKVHLIEPLLLSSTNVKDAITTIKNALPKLDTLIIIGGDGTINVAITALIQAKKFLPIGIIPAGTVNNFARRYNIPLDITAAMQLLVENHEQRQVGFAICNNTKAVVSSLTFGNLADISNQVRQQEKRKFGKIIYLIKAVKHIGKDKSFLIHYQSEDGTDQILKTWFALITTTKSIGGHVYSTSSPNKMHISLLNNIGIKQVLPYCFFALTGRLNNSKSITQFEVENIKISAIHNRKITTRIDGDKALDLPIEVSYRSKELSLFVPKK
ncbi:diacylglycerol kinase [Ligilactobacillus sp. WILCCON 0076]|uniref:Diacylglycerol kinase n=1 Tax=Ligilactobacillus ubinensis TaxID=2876789 RepID=A0A9X2JLX9_9LACO|nr:diacylglycerol kinase family protein [Ligilactobacillus ubinensis]MCP0887487.1 diacylglycerol kinase [Ligilactobacillus ubinensis]